MLAVRLRRFVRNQREQAVQLERIDPQARGEAAEDAGAVVLGEIFADAAAGIGAVLLVAAIGAAGPVSRVDPLAVGRARLDRSARIGRADPAGNLPPHFAFGAERGP